MESLEPTVIDARSKCVSATMLEPASSGLPRRLPGHLSTMWGVYPRCACRHVVAARESFWYSFGEARSLPEFHAADAKWWAAAVAMAALTVATIVGNAGVVSALWRARRSPQHYPLASLAVADLLVGVSVLPLAAAGELFTFRLSFFVCACFNTLDVLCCTASILSLCALGWERYHGITHPLSRAERTKWAKRLTLFVWPVAAAVAIPTAFMKSERVDTECKVNTNPSYVFFSVTFSFYLPTIVMLVLYGLIIRALASRPAIRAHRGQAPIVELDELKTCPESLKTAANEGGASEQQRRATITIVRLMGLFLICWSPFFIMLPIHSICSCVDDLTLQWCTWLGYMNSTLNPFVYATAAPWVQQAFQALLKMTQLGGWR